MRLVCVCVWGGGWFALWLATQSLTSPIGVLAPLGVLALAATMTAAAWQPILTAGLNIYALELVVLYLGGNLALLLKGPGRLPLMRPWPPAQKPHPSAHALEAFNGAR